MNLSTINKQLAQSPLTDPRSVGASMAIHALLIVAAASVAVLGGLPSHEPKATRAIMGELDPVDNRAIGSGGPGGGSPGEIGNDRLSTTAPPPGESETSGSANRDPAADALLAEILPSRVEPETVRQSLPGPQTSSVGVLPGPSTGTGGGGGSGGGMGGGIGRGIGPGTEFFGAKEHAGSFAYVIDCSGSMAMKNSLEIAKRELTVSLNRLPPDARFGVVFYNTHATVFTDQQGRQAMMTATAANKSRVRDLLRAILPAEGTDHVLALRAALALKPEVIFFLTDAEAMADSDVTTLLTEVGKARIQAVKFGLGPELGGGLNPLKRLATTTGGAYRYIDVLAFPGRE